MTPSRIKPVGRLRVLVGGGVLLAALAMVVGLTETLRHPPTVAPVPEPHDPADPRQTVDCPDPADRHPGDAPVRVSSSDLYDCPHVYDGRAVHYEGEVVGALLWRADGTWTQLNDDAYAGDLGPLPAHREFRGGNAGVGVHLPRELAGHVAWVGGPDARGDVLGVVGTFHKSDAESREVAVLRVSDGHVVRAGEPIDHRPLPDRQVVGVVLALAALSVVVAERFAAARRAG